jgi:hypothetical protein
MRMNHLPPTTVGGVQFRPKGNNYFHSATGSKSHLRRSHPKAEHYFQTSVASTCGENITLQLGQVDVVLGLEVLKREDGLLQAENLLHRLQQRPIRIARMSPFMTDSSSHLPPPPAIH